MKNNLPLVSIVLPVYNGSQFLSESLDSCINQSYQNWELIIVNDCSTDNSLEIALKYAALDARIRIVNNDLNLKLPASLNKGFADANGEYYTWTSHDNIMHKDMLKIFVDELNSNSNVGMVTAGYTAIDIDGNELYDVNQLDPQIYLALSNVICYAFMYRKEVALTVGDYNENLFLIEDYDYWIRIWLKYKIKQVNKSLYFNRIHKDSLTASRREEIALRLLQVRLNYFDAFNKTLCEFPELQFEFFVAILDQQTGLVRFNWALRFIYLSPIRFGLNYFFSFAPRRYLKSLRKKILQKR